MCPNIREIVEFNLRKAIKALNYSPDIIPEDPYAFFCPRSSPCFSSNPNSSPYSSSPHCARFSKKFKGLTCTNKKGIFHSLTDEQLLWFTESPSKTGNFLNTLYRYQFYCTHA